MKRTPEFVLGLIGGILGIIISIILIVVAFNIMEGVDYELLAYYSIILTVQIGLFILSCLVNKVNNKVYGVCMIVIPIVMLFMSLFFLLIPTILQIIPGSFAFRTLKLESNVS
ncbi:hypothetical protein ABE48_21480 [Bacillus thuringiensis]|uniref:DUF4064 domain-containing protein n=1 Tax=Bacillus cereus group TaxID=86661 RepID=UPI000BF2833B|nr:MULTISPECIES: DUF4064 domain-containing protein [Bacillus cereus group]MBG9533656.1 hypothetical protein [Bacillus thuringiensis]MCC3685075.1 DUF4064 domain-containing protein [Bacillus cereus]PEV16720.1 hypothetical protein CN407_01180 [Bacillus cereus]PGM67430.1 hypothetical protein CN950_12730 [Bacillus cereus]HDR8452639.1 DUF4064 domain-containing protein [Bacillus cereus]